MWICVKAPARLGETDAAEHLRGELERPDTAQLLVSPDSGHQLLADGEHGIEARHRLLKDHCDASAAQLAQSGSARREDVLAIEHRRAADHRPGRRELQQRQRSHALATAALADDPEDRVSRDDERDVADRAQERTRARQVHAEIGDLQQVRCHSRPRIRGSRTSRRPSPRAFSPITSVARTAAGSTTIQADTDQ